MTFITNTAFQSNKKLTKINLQKVSQYGFFLLLLIALFGIWTQTVVYAEDQSSPTIDIRLSNEKPQYSPTEFLRIFITVSNYNESQNVILTITDPTGANAFESFIPENRLMLPIDERGNASTIFEIPKGTESGEYVITSYLTLNSDKYSDSVSFYVNSTYPCGTGQQLLRGICISDKEACLMNNNCSYDEKTGGCECVTFDPEIPLLFIAVIIIVIISVIVAFAFIKKRRV